MADLQKIVEDLSKLNVLEAAALVRMLEEKWSKELPTPSLSAEELKSTRADLEVWRAPMEFFEKVAVLAKRTASEGWFNAPRLGFLRDAMILGEFARQLEGARRVRLAAEADRFPDGFVETSNGTLRIEVTEVDRETRRRGDEYKAGGPPSETVDDWEEQAKAIPAELERVILKKVSKHYNPAPTLVVYLNLNGHGTRKNEIHSIIGNSKRKYALSFQSIYVLWNGRLL
jgi:Ribosomal protein L7/L12 dimerisation domain